MKTETGRGFKEKGFTSGLSKFILKEYAGKPTGSYIISLHRLTENGFSDYNDFRLEFHASPVGGPGFFKFRFKAVVDSDTNIPWVYHDRYYDPFGKLHGGLSSEISSNHLSDRDKLLQLGLAKISECPPLIHMHATVTNFIENFRSNNPSIKFITPDMVVDPPEVLSKLTRTEKRKYYKGLLQFLR